MNVLKKLIAILLLTSTSVLAVFAAPLDRRNWEGFKKSVQFDERFAAISNKAQAERLLELVDGFITHGSKTDEDLKSAHEAREVLECIVVYEGDSEGEGSFGSDRDEDVETYNMLNRDAVAAGAVAVSAATSYGLARYTRRSRLAAGITSAAVGAATLAYAAYEQDWTTRAKSWYRGTDKQQK